MRQTLFVTRLGCSGIRNYGTSKKININLDKSEPSIIKVTSSSFSYMNHCFQLNERTGKQSGDRGKKQRKFRFGSLLLLVSLLYRQNYSLLIISLGGPWSSFRAWLLASAETDMEAELD